MILIDKNRKSDPIVKDLIQEEKVKHALVILFLVVTFALGALADIQVTYTGMTTEQEAAFEYAASLWEPVLTSAIPIKINVRMQNLPGFVSVIIPNLIRNFNGAMPNVWYCNALANAITGEELNTGEADFDVIFDNSAASSWYFGTDGNCPTNSYDFVTEVVKGIAYGLGYMSSFYVQSGYGSYGMLNPSVLGLTTSFPWEDMQNQPALYDIFICNTQEEYLTNTALFGNPSPALNAQLTGGALRYAGFYGTQFDHASQPVLYAQAFNLARTAKLYSSVYNGTENTPGVPTGVLGAAYHSPAPIVLGMLMDQGWDLNLEVLAAAPIAFDAHAVSMTAIELNWEAPNTPYEIQEYMVYRDGYLIGSTMINQYWEEDLAPGYYTYEVRTRYSFTMSPPTETMTVYLPEVENDDQVMPAADLSLKVMPNPLRNNGTIRLKNVSSNPIRIELYDLKGRYLETVFAGSLAAGDHDIPLALNADDAARPSGIYFVRCVAGNRTTAQKVLLLRK